MRISCENGDITIADTKEVILLILSLAEKGMNEIWISKDGSLYPALAVLVNGGYACLNYFGMMRAICICPAAMEIPRSPLIPAVRNGLHLQTLLFQ